MEEIGFLSIVWPLCPWHFSYIQGRRDMLADNLSFIMKFSYCRKLKLMGKGDQTNQRSQRCIVDPGVFLGTIAPYVEVFGCDHDGIGFGINCGQPEGDLIEWNLPEQTTFGTSFQVVEISGGPFRAITPSNGLQSFRIWIQIFRRLIGETVKALELQNDVLRRVGPYNHHFKMTTSLNYHIFREWNKFLIISIYLQPAQNDHHLPRPKTRDDLLKTRLSSHI